MRTETITMGDDTVVLDVARVRVTRLDLPLGNLFKLCFKGIIAFTMASLVIGVFLLPLLAVFGGGLAAFLSGFLGN